MAFTSPPTPPNILDPATFPARAAAWVSWLCYTFIPQLTAAMLSFGPGSAWCTQYQGVNVIKLSSGTQIGALAVGQQVRWRATVANTGAGTIDLDNLGDQLAVTVTNAQLPPGYIRTDVDTVATWTGTRWMVERRVERGSNANGSFTRWEDGTMICRHTLFGLGAPNVASGSGFRSARQVWIYPAVFAVEPVPIITGFRDNVDPPVITAGLADRYAGSVGFWLECFTAQAGSDFKATATAIAPWY